MIVVRLVGRIPITSWIYGDEITADKEFHNAGTGIMYVICYECYMWYICYMLRMLYVIYMYYTCEFMCKELYNI